MKNSLVYRGFLLGFLAISSLFFLWAVANNLNDILIRQFQKALDLTRGQSGFIQFVFYLGYFVIALPAGYMLRRIGYRRGIIVGLCVYALGAILFFPAAELHAYPAFLAALFVIAAGVAVLETAANPYIARFGPPERAAQRLNLAQAFNGLGAFLAPVIGGLFIFSGVELDADAISRLSAQELKDYRLGEARQVQVPYLVLAGIVLVGAGLISWVKLPEITEDGEGRFEAGGEFDHLKSPINIPHLRGAVIAQFFYVGAQVVIWSFFIDYTIDVLPGTSEKTAAFMLSLSVFSFMGGRFLGTFLMGFMSEQRLLAVYSGLAGLLCVVALVSDGMFAVLALGLTSLFMSIMFPTIFAMGIDRAGRHTKLGSSFLIMAIIGGALFPPAAGFLSDFTGDIRHMVAPALLSFVVIFLFAQLYPRLSESVQAAPSEPYG